MTGMSDSEFDPHTKKVEQTKAKTRAAFLDLCSQKKIESITIKELTTLAGINRSTFYSHYTDIYDLRKQILDEFARSALEQAVPVITCIVNGDDSSETIASLTDFYNENMSVFRAFLGNNLDPQLTEKMQTIIKSLIYETSGESEQRQPEYLEYVLEYMAAGHVALISRWAVSEATISTEELIKLIKAINLEGPIKYLIMHVRS